ncbi:UNVERIFIED_ORG: hypothetical protein ABIB63_001316 [Xanthomonas axonopodis]
MSSLPPPLPPLSSVPSAAPPPPAVVKKPLSSVAIGLIGVATCVVLLGMLALGALVWLMSIGWSLFADQARSALQADAVVQEHIGHIRDMRVDLYRTSLAPGAMSSCSMCKAIAAAGACTPPGSATVPNARS